MDIKEIISAWRLKFNAPDEFASLAERRASICKSCEQLKEIIRGKEWTYLCGECGCPIAGKSFSPKQNACPLEKWKEIDQEYYTKKIKTTKTLI